MTILAYIAIFLVYIICPAYLKIVMCAINLFIPDPLPYVDEILMAAGFFINPA